MRVWAKGVGQYLPSRSNTAMEDNTTPRKVRAWPSVMCACAVDVTFRLLPCHRKWFYVDVTMA